MAKKRERGGEKIKLDTIGEHAVLWGFVGWETMGGQMLEGCIRLELEQGHGHLQVIQ